MKKNDLFPDNQVPKTAKIGMARDWYLPSS
jgi:hypothetical protein